MEFGKQKDLTPTEVVERAVNFVNNALQKGRSAYEMKEIISVFPRPIIVDFNNVLANNTDPLMINPEAPNFLNQLQKIGWVFIVTSAWSWDGVQEFLEEQKSWNNRLILLSGQNYIPIEDSETKITDVLREKRVASIFNKPYLVPIIDNSETATFDNPGMLGIQVQTWEPNFTGGENTFLDSFNEGKPTLKVAVEIVKSHYDSLRSSMTSEAIK